MAFLRCCRLKAPGSRDQTELAAASPVQKITSGQYLFASARPMRRPKAKAIAAASTTATTDAACRAFYDATKNSHPAKERRRTCLLQLTRCVMNEAIFSLEYVASRLVSASQNRWQQQR